MTGKNILITGASSGIGAACAELFARRGCRVWGTTRQPSRAKKTWRSTAAIRFVEMDVTSDASVARAVEQVLQEAGHIDVLVNNAGGAIYGPVEEVPTELAIHQFDLNVFGLLRVTKAVVPHMRERRSGTVVNISSLAGKFVIPFQVHYSASKHAVEAFTEGLRQELRPFGVRVVGILPGDINTNFNNATVFPEGIWEKGSAYSRWLSASWRTIDANLQKAPPPEVVARQVWKAVTARRPRPRYPAGDFWSCRFLFLARLLPDTAKEWAIRMFYNINFR